MDNFKTEKKYAIKVEGVWETPYIYDYVQRYDKSVIGRREKERKLIGDLIVVDAKHTIEGFSLETGKKLFCIDNVISWGIYEEYYIIRNDNDKYYIFFDETQKIHGPFNEIRFTDDYILVMNWIKQNDNAERIYGVYSIDGDVILPKKYNNIIFRANDIIEVWKKGKKGFVNAIGNPLIYPKYDTIIFYPNTDFVKVSSGEKYGVVEIDGDNIIPVENREIIYEKKAGVFLVENSLGLWGLYDNRGIEILPNVFSECYSDHKAPFIKFWLDDNLLFYSTDMKKLFQPDCIRFYKRHYEYFLDAKWHRVSYKKNK